jgi:hypothetical protein
MFLGLGFLGKDGGTNGKNDADLSFKTNNHNKNLILPPPLVQRPEKYRLWLGAGRWSPKKNSPAAQGKMKMTWENIAYDQVGRWTSPVIGLGGGGRETRGTRGNKSKYWDGLLEIKI